jgi:hypothetical protein
MHAAVVETKDQRMDIHMPAVSLWMTSAQTRCWVHPGVHAYSYVLQTSDSATLLSFVNPRVLGMVSKLRGVLELEF